MNTFSEIYNKRRTITYYEDNPNGEWFRVSPQTGAEIYYIFPRPDGKVGFPEGIGLKKHADAIKCNLITKRETCFVGTALALNTALIQAYILFTGVLLASPQGKIKDGYLLTLLSPILGKYPLTYSKKLE